MEIRLGEMEQFFRERQMAQSRHTGHCSLGVVHVLFGEEIFEGVPVVFEIEVTGFAAKSHIIEPFCNRGHGDFGAERFEVAD